MQKIGMTAILLLTISSLTLAQEPLSVVPTSVLGFKAVVTEMSETAVRLDTCVSTATGAVTCAVASPQSSGWLVTPKVRCTTDCARFPVAEGEGIYELPATLSKLPLNVPVLLQLRLCRVNADKTEACSATYTMRVIVGNTAPPREVTSIFEIRR